jgi:hypothetical protein
MTTLSVCTITDRHPDVVALALAPLRAAATEIVVALDHRAPIDGLDTLRAVADTIVRVEYESPLEVNLAWLHAQCNGDWVLRIDGDEVPSAALVRRLAAGGWDRDVTHAYVARRWVWPDAERYLTGFPWTPDPQLRLVRNDPALIRFPTKEHELPTVAGPARFLDEALYHLDTVVDPESNRRRKAAMYEQRAPGIRTEDGRPQNLGFYVPESATPTPATGPIPDEDRAVVASVVAAFDRGERGEPSLDGVVTIASRRPAPPTPGGASVELVHLGPARWLQQQTATVTVAVTNDGDQTWDPNEPNPVRIGGRLLGPDGSVRIGELRADLPCRVPPGGRELVRLAVGLLPTLGEHRLVVGAVREHVAWFDAETSAPVEVVRWPRVVLSAGFSSFRHLGDDLIVGAAVDAVRDGVPDAQLVLLADDPGFATSHFALPAVSSASPIVHHGGPAPDRATALERIAALRADAERFAAGLAPEHAHHAGLIAVLGDADALVLLGAGWLTSSYWQAQVLPKLAEAEVAHALGVPVVFESGTIGPIEAIDDPIVARLLAICERVAIRDGATSRANA